MTDDLSPELVLVDPALGERVRSRLPDPGDTLERVEAMVYQSRLTSLALRHVEAPEQAGRSVNAAGGGITRLGRRPSALLAGVLAACALMVALLVGVRVDLGGAPAGADTETTRVMVPAYPQQTSGVSPTASQRPVGPPVRATDPKRPSSAAEQAPQRFAWAPTPEASGYHVELFRGSSKVFETDTTRASATVPARWVFQQRTQILEPGEYRWYVWPLVSGRRAATATVQAKLVVPPR